MNKLISLLSKNSLRVNYFTFFVVSVLCNILAAFLPFGINVVLMQVLKFLMIFSVVMFVANQMRVIRICFWCLLAYCGLNLLLGLSYTFIEIARSVTFNLFLGAGLSILYLFVLILLLRNALSKMKSIAVSLLVLELYNICKPFIYNVISSISGEAVTSEIFVVCWNIIPFLLMIPLFILIAQHGKERWNLPGVVR